MNEFYRKSGLTHQMYDVFKMVRIVNIQQASAYINNGVFPEDIIIDLDENTKQRRMVFLFDREGTREVYDKWCKYELE